MDSLILESDVIPKLSFSRTIESNKRITFIMFLFLIVLSFCCAVLYSFLLYTYAIVPYFLGSP
ncbi:hypothetical protein BDQ17DRAFT_489335 [Cyathus striatus]|nr:hypothetical protein BDQ17DRAFT_489335 [Cyathus striatus]